MTTSSSDAPVLSVVVLSWNTQELTLACLKALYAEQPRHSREIIVVDNGSEDASADQIAEQFPQVRLLRNPDNRLYAGGNNQGARMATGRVPGGEAASRHSILYKVLVSGALASTSRVMARQGTGRTAGRQAGGQVGRMAGRTSAR